MLLTALHLPPLSVTALLPCNTPALNQKVAVPAHSLPFFLWSGYGAWGMGLAKEQKASAYFHSAFL